MVLDLNSNKVSVSQQENKWAQRLSQSICTTASSQRSVLLRHGRLQRAYNSVNSWSRRRNNYQLLKKSGLHLVSPQPTNHKSALNISSKTIVRMPCYLRSKHSNVGSKTINSIYRGDSTLMLNKKYSCGVRYSTKKIIICLRINIMINKN